MLSSLASDDTNFDQCGLLNPGLAVLSETRHWSEI